MNKKEALLFILNDINDGKRSENGVYHDQELFGDVVEIAIDEGFIKGADVRRGGRGNKVVLVSIETAKITLKGLDYLERKNVIPL